MMTSQYLNTNMTINKLISYETKTETKTDMSALYDKNTTSIHLIIVNRVSRLLIFSVYY